MIKNEDVVKKIRRSDCLNFFDFDNLYNIDTSHPLKIAPDGSGELIPGFLRNSIDIAGANGLQNTALPFLDLINNFFENIDNAEEYIFIEIGSGKGKVIFYNLLQNAPYKSYIGIEADPYFNNIAINNLKTTNINIDKDVNFIEQNALDYIASSDNCIYYFYYPFNKEIFEKFMENNWEIISKTDSYFVFLFEDDYDFKRYLNKNPLYDYAEITIYKVGKND